MDPLLAFATVASSTALRILAYVFFRWIPAEPLPPIIYGLLAIYLASFVFSSSRTSPYEVIADEVGITIKEGRQNGESSNHSDNPQESTEDDKVIEEVDVEETLVLEERDAHTVWTLFSGVPSPSSQTLSLITAGVNILLTLAVFDAVHRGPALHPSNDLAFVRTGFVSDREARILIREPDSSATPIYVSYRNADDARDDAWKTASTIYGTSNETDYTATVTIGSLKADTKYQYTTSTNRTAFFVTAPGAGQASNREDQSFTFVTSSCIKAGFPYNPLSHPLAIPGLRHLAENIPALKARFMLFLGDFIYIDVPKRFGKDVESYRREYRMVYNSPEWESVSRNLPWIHVLDDHEIANDWDRNTSGVYEAAVEPWKHYQSSVNPPEVRRGHSYFTFTQGPASFFMLDTRRYRSEKSCGPASDGCRTMLGPEQLEDLLRWLRQPVPRGVHWKIVASSVPFTKNWQVGTDDTWGGYLAERATILEAMWAEQARGEVGVVVVSGDRHEFAATRFPPPRDSRWPSSAAVHEFSTSPLSQFYLPIRTYRQEDEEDELIKYIPDGRSKYGAISILPSSLASSASGEGSGRSSHDQRNVRNSQRDTGTEQSMLRFTLYRDGRPAWGYVLTTSGVDSRGSGKGWSGGGAGSLAGTGTGTGTGSGEGARKESRWLRDVLWG